MKFSRVSSRFALLLIASTVLLSACAPAAEESVSEPVVADEAAPAEENSSSLEAEVSETSGTVQEIDQSKVVVNDLTIAITGDTEMSESPQAGDEVAVRYVTDADGELSAQAIEILSKASADDGAGGEDDEEIDY
jgi:hypothetical protein